MSLDVKAYAKFRWEVFHLDNTHCRNPKCERLNPTWLSLHHIKYRSQGGSDTPENTITLCRSCDHAVHHGYGKGAERLTGRQFMLKILDDLIDDPGYRWHEVHKELRRRYTNDRPSLS